MPRPGKACSAQRGRATPAKTTNYAIADTADPKNKLYQKRKNTAGTRQSAGRSKDAAYTQTSNGHLPTGRRRPIRPQRPGNQHASQMGPTGGPGRGERWRRAHTGNLSPHPHRKGTRRHRRHEVQKPRSKREGRAAAEAKRKTHARQGETQYTSRERRTQAEADKNKKKRDGTSPALDKQT